MRKSKPGQRKPGLKLALVIATKDRPQEIRRMLRSVDCGRILPDEIIIVDSGHVSVDSVAKEFPRLPIRHMRCWPPSATRQRNLGIRSAPPETSLIGVFDDDIVLEPDALEKMQAFWANAEEGLGGAAFNMMNHPPRAASWLKSLKLVERLGLYSARPGMVMPSGFQTMIGCMGETTEVQWLSTGASVFRREVFSEFSFDERFSGYSYLEDLDFSYRVGKKYSLMVVADAGYRHFPCGSGRGAGREFGKREMTNRFYFVQKHPELSRAKCRLGLFFRLAISLGLALKSMNSHNWQRVWGNCLGLADVLTGRV